MQPHTRHSAELGCALYWCSVSAVVACRATVYCTMCTSKPMTPTVAIERSAQCCGYFGGCPINSFGCVRSVCDSRPYSHDSLRFLCVALSVSSSMLLLSVLLHRSPRTVAFANFCGSSSRYWRTLWRTHVEKRFFCLQRTFFK